MTFARLVGWPGCLARLLVKEVVMPEVDTIVSMEDVISLDDDQEAGEKVLIERTVSLRPNWRDYFKI